MEWTRVGGNETVYSAYADPASIRRDGAHARMRGLYDYRQPDLSPQGLPYRSTIVEREYDCAARLVRLLAHIDHAGQMGAGAVVAAGNWPPRWEPVVAGAIDEAFLALACR